MCEVLETTETQLLLAAAKFPSTWQFPTLLEATNTYS
jgi:hypothetical protein